MLKSKKILTFLCISFLVIITIVAVLFSIKSIWGMDKYYMDGNKLNSTQVNDITDTFNITLSEGEYIKRLCIFSYKNDTTEYILEIKTDNDLENFLDSNPYIKKNFNVTQLKECYYDKSIIFIKVVKNQSIDKDHYILNIIDLYQKIFKSTLSWGISYIYGKHTAILFDGKVYDNLFPEGIDYDKWIDGFLAASGQKNIEMIDFWGGLCKINSLLWFQK